MLPQHLLDAVLVVIDNKLAVSEPTRIEDLEFMQRLLEARTALERGTLQAST